MDITSANAKCFLTIEELFPAGVLLQNYATDQAVDQDERQISIVRMGVDGHMAAGWTPQPHIIHFTFEANSPSLTYIRALAKYMETQKKIVRLGLAINIPSISTSFMFSNGILTNAKDFPALKQVLDPVTAAFAFETRS